jgi:flagellar biosynthesis chaperone FliJ
MKKFEFRLASVLRLYEARLELEKQKLGRMVAEEQRIIRSIEKLSEDMRTQNQYLRELIELQSTELRALSTYNLSTQARILTFGEELRTIRRAIQTQVQALIPIERKVKLLAKLKHRRRAEWESAVEQDLERECHELWLATHQVRSV